MKILIVGLGSVGQRHVRILSKLGNASFIYVPSGAYSTKQEFLSQYRVSVMNSLEEGLQQNPDCGIIANANTGHVSTAKHFLEQRLPFLIEKPVSTSLDGLGDIVDRVSSMQLPVLVGFQLRYHPTFIELRRLLDSKIIGRPLALQGYVGQYLPQWRTGIDYRCSVSASKSLGGGVLSDICHEIDIALTLLGPACTVSANLAHVSNLEIDTEDIADLFLLHESGARSTIHLNYLDRKFRWTTRILGTLGTLTWDYVGGTLSIDLADKEHPRLISDPEGFTRDMLFEKQMQHFLAVVDRREEPIVPLSDGVEVTKVLASAYLSSQTSRVLSV